MYGSFLTRNYEELGQLKVPGDGLWRTISVCGIVFRALVVASSAYLEMQNKVRYKILKTANLASKRQILGSFPGYR